MIDNRNLKSDHEFGGPRLSERMETVNKTGTGDSDN